MNNDLSIRPAYLGGSIAPEGAFAETLGFAQPPRVSMKDDRFNPIDENGAAVLPPSLNLDVIILWENDTRLYYPKGDYDRDAGIPPTCYSDNRITPSVGAMQPQSELCANCPHSVWDQPTPRGNLVPACDSRYKVACLVAGAGGQVFLLSVGPASRKGYEQYRRHLKSHHAEAAQVITKLGYVDKAFTFAFGGWITEKTVEFVRKLFETDEPALVVNANDKPRQLGLPKPKDSEFERGLTVFHAPSAALTQQPMTGAPAAEQAPAGRRRGRPPLPPKEPPAASASPSIPQQSFSAPKGNGDGFGMQAPEPLSPNIQDALDRAFGPR